MKHKRLIKPVVAAERQAIQSTHSEASATNTNKPTGALGVRCGDPNSEVSPVGPKEGAIIQEIVEALDATDIHALPEIPRGDTIRGLLWALEALVAPLTEPRLQHNAPFNARLAREEAEVGQAVINEVWQVSCAVLCGLVFLRTRGYVSRSGVECPADWSPGDFWSAVDDACAAMERLKALTQKLYELRYGPVPTKPNPPASGAGAA